MAPTLNNITTMEQLKTYARDGSVSALKECPNTDGYDDALMSALKGAPFATVKAQLIAANKTCHYEKYGTVLSDVAAGGGPPTGTSSGGSTPPPGGDSSNITVQKAGFPLWPMLLIGGGLLAYYLLSKDKKTGQRKGKRLVTKARRKVRKAVKKVRKARARRRRR